jgi:hypothetical protein
VDGDAWQASVGTLARWKCGKHEQNNTITRMQALAATAFRIFNMLYSYLFIKNTKMYPRIGFFLKMPYPRIRIRPILIHVSISVLHSI